MISLTVSQLNLFISSLCVTATTTMISSDHRSDSSTSSFLFSIPSCFFFFFFIILVLLSLSSPSSSANALSSHSQQCLDLLNLKKGFIMLNESYANYFSITSSIPHWRAGTDCCRWEGVSCDEASGLVVSLDLSDRLIGGDIIPSLFNLTSLQRLNLAFNIFQPERCPAFGFGKKLANLTHLNVSIPDCCGAKLSLTLFPGLQLLSLQESSLSGPIDSSLSKLQNLSILRLDFNNLSSHVPDFFANFSSLTVLSLSGCGLKGLFPTSMFELLNLKTLYLSYNEMLEGVFPEFPLNSSLEILIISSTNFSGSLPNSLGNLESLISLDLRHCNFSGSIPWSIGNLSELVYLDLSYNHLSGHLPPMLAGSKISTIDLSSNYFIGQIPSTLGHAHHLISLHLEDNLLTGSIPMSLFTLKKLEKLSLVDNKLSGQLQEFTNASSTLQYVGLWGNNLHGKLPKSLVNLFALISLDLSSNNFDGSVMGLELFGHLQNLTYLDLSGIDLSISHRIVGSSLLFPSLHTLKLQSCNLMAIPSFLKHKKNMGLLDLSNNRINGVIPKWIWGIGRSLNLSYNLFNDIERPLPDPKTMMSINSLDLHSNMLQGQIPLLHAQFLDYSNNYFTGSIPLNISAYLLGTSAFFLANNNLTGEIPASICDTYLQILDLSKNNLSGSIQGCLLESLSNLQALNLRENQFQGILPQNINSSCSLVTIDFYGNKSRRRNTKIIIKM
ncbi:receptor-like protein 6 [Dioscorea cayenensis subsp. rotundata]|uniref:Receptor-like protein 6 n=1 Tax=Dioscorea cayennensis subsp. rotundata TaxID=55577 RepID=A0AB40BNX1_DIOCR|nr:receptor-like protein 6 [Dioscorea cayenensis subsp. rotundata]